MGCHQSFKIPTKRAVEKRREEERPRMSSKTRRKTPDVSENSSYDLGKSKKKAVEKRREEKKKEEIEIKQLARKVESRYTQTIN